MSPRPQPSSDAPFDAALALARAGRFDEALAALRRAAGAGSRHADAALAFAELARTAEESGAARHALEALDAATALAPGYADLHYRRGCALITAQRHADARAA
ncbi:MAG: hypothetical protein HY076_07975, partial [Candidatus Eisenbacteria bacterium]|nr:hypothetical protein [Candidatus Eisenbacteria bacterium]